MTSEAALCPAVVLGYVSRVLPSLPDGGLAHKLTSEITLHLAGCTGCGGGICALFCSRLEATTSIFAAWPSWCAEAAPARMI